MFKPIRLFYALKSSLRRYQSTCMPIQCNDPATQITILGNGIRVATEYQPTALACMGLFFEAGSRFETSYNNGITHFLEHMAYRGFLGMSRFQLEEHLQCIGARMSANTGREVQSFTGTFPSSNAAEMLDLLSGVVRNLEMNFCEIQLAKFSICLEMLDEENDPRSVVFDYLHQTAFQGTPLGQRVIGPTNNVKKFDGSAAINYLQQHYQPYKLCLVSSGKINHEDMVRRAESKLGGIIGEAACESDEGPTRFTGSQVVYRDDSMPFAHVAVAFEAPGYTSPDFMKLYVASHIIGNWHKNQGGGEGNASYIARGACLDDACERFESFYITYRDTGLWGAYYVARRWDVDNVIDQIQLKWMHICVTAHATELERAINLAKLQLARDICGVEKSCIDIGTQLMYTCTRKSLEEKYHELSTLRHIEVREAVERMMYDRCPAVAAMGPTETLPDYTRLRASQYWLRL